MGNTSTRLAAALIIGSALIGSADAKLSRAEQKAVNATPQQIADSIEIDDDKFSPFVTISTEPFFKTGGGPIYFGPGSDKFVRAFIDRKTGATKFQIYFWARYLGEWHSFSRFGYLENDEPVNSDLIQIDQQVGGCTSYAGCYHIETVALPLSITAARNASKDAVAGVDASWMFKLYGKISGGWETGILKTEIAGALLAVDAYKAAHNLPTEDVLR